VFRKPYSFSSLSILLLEGIPLQDDDILHIHQLPSLSNLNLSSTGITDVGYVSLLRRAHLAATCSRVFHLVALRRTLITLLLRGNPIITNDSLPALLTLSCLHVLGLRGTAVGMSGLRRLARFSEHLHLDVPANCEVYLGSSSHSRGPRICANDGVELHTQYLLSPHPPLVSSPEEAYILDFVSLKRNLSAHASQNSAISTIGGKAALCGRLVELLERRRGDLAVRVMVRRCWSLEDDEISSDKSGRYT
jgi:hypothetical protein